MTFHVVYGVNVMFKALILGGKVRGGPFCSK